MKLRLSRALLFSLVFPFVFSRCSPVAEDISSESDKAVATYDAIANETQEAWVAQWATESMFKATENRATDFAQMTATIELPTFAVLTATESADQTAIASPLVPTPTISAEPHAIVNVAPGEVLNIHSEPGLPSSTIGWIPPFGQTIYIMGREQEVNGDVWVPVTYKGVYGWVKRGNLALQRGFVEAELAALANEVMYSLKTRDLALLSTYVHPEKGLRFSPYARITGSEPIFSPEDASVLVTDSTRYFWGYGAGLGNRIVLSFEEYFARYVNDGDFAQAEVVNFNETISKKSLDNTISDFYPNSIVVMYYLSGEYSPYSWHSLRLVFEREDEVWCLVAIAHNEWTL